MLGERGVSKLMAQKDGACLDWEQQSVCVALPYTQNSLPPHNGTPTDEQGALSCSPPFPKSPMQRRRRIEHQLDRLLHATWPPPSSSSWRQTIGPETPARSSQKGPHGGAGEPHPPPPRAHTLARISHCYCAELD